MGKSCHNQVLQVLYANTIYWQSSKFSFFRKKKKKKEKQLWRIVLEINWTKQQISMQILKITTGLLVSSTGTLNWILFSF